MKIYREATKELVKELNESANVYWEIGDDVVNVSRILEEVRDLGFNTTVKGAIATGSLFLICNGFMVEVGDDIVIHFKNKKKVLK